MMVTLATSGFDEIPLRWAQPLLRLERGEGEGGLGRGAHLRGFRSGS